MSMTLRWSLLLTCLLVPALCLAGATRPQAPPAADPEATDPQEIVAKVNDAPIYRAQIQPLVEARIQKLHQMRSGQIDVEYRKSLERRALEQFFADELFCQEGRKLEIPDFEEKVASALERLQSTSRHTQLSKEQLEERARRQVYISAYMDQSGLANPQVPEEDIRAFYEQSKESLTNPESARVRHIVVLIPENATEKEKAAAREKITEARKLILDGTPFEEVAQSHSEDNTASGGGDLGPVKRHFMPPEFDAVAFSIELNQLSEVVKTAFGYHILEVSARHAGGTPPFEQVKEFLGTYLQGNLKREMITQHVQQLTAKAEIEILLN